ncbi:hypothetical protein STFR1_20291 [Bacillus vallismortis]
MLSFPDTNSRTEKELMIWMKKTIILTVGFGLPKIGISGMNCCPMVAILKLAAMSNAPIQVITK